MPALSEDLTAPLVMLSSLISQLLLQAQYTSTSSLLTTPTVVCTYQQNFNNKAMDKAKAGEASWRTRSHNNSFAGNRLQFGANEDSVDLATMITQAPAPSGTILLAPLATSPSQSSAFNTLNAISSSTMYLMSATPSNIESATVTPTGIVSSGPTTELMTPTPSLPPPSAPFSQVSTRVSSATETITSTTATSSDTYHASKTQIPIVVGAVVPCIAVVCLLAFLFCYWLKKKRQREKVLDDLERTAIWIQSPSKGTMTHDSSHTDQQTVAERAGSVDAEIKSSEAQSIADISSHSSYNSSLVNDRASPNPFATPISPADALVRKSQIGLAVTTSMYPSNEPNTSTGTIVRRASRKSSNPFFPSTPMPTDRTPYSANDDTPTSMEASTIRRIGIEAPANSVSTPFMRTEQLSALNECVRLKHHVCNDDTVCPLTQLRYTEILDIDRRIKLVKEASTGAKDIGDVFFDPGEELKHT